MTFNMSNRPRRTISRLFSAIEPLEGRLLFSGGPAAPTGLSAINGSTATDIVLTWNASSGATSYQIWRGTTANTSSATDIDSDVTSTTYDDTNVTVGTTYFYWVVASNSSGNSGFSTIANGTGGTLVFNDTFGTQGITSAWSALNSTDPNNSEVIYTNTTPSESNPTNPTTLAIVSDSLATNGQALAMSLTPSPTQSGDYDSAEICTEIDPSGDGNSIEYGEIQARIRIPGGNNSGAIWPAFWLLGDDISSVGWPDCGEIDVMENKGSEPSTIFSTIHGPAAGGGDYNGGDGVGSSYTLSGGQDFYSSYHLFTVDWGPNSITFSVDGTTFATITPSSLPGGASWVFNGHPFFIILDVCEGGAFAPGTITSTQTMYIDDVRAYSFSAPTGLLASSATDSTPAMVSWDAVTGATSYEVWRGTTSNVTDATELASDVMGTSYSDTSATVGDNYYYWVVAANAYQTSGYSNAVYTKLTATLTLPSAPSNIYYDGTNDVDNWITPTLTGVSGDPAPTGSVSLAYYSGSSDTGTPLSSTPITPGTYTVVANYPGDTYYSPAQSSPVTFTIENPAGLTTLSGTEYSITWSGDVPTIEVTSGRVTLSADMSTTFPGYILSIQSGAVVLLDSSQHLSQLLLSGTAMLNMQNYWLIINYGSGPDPISSIAAAITSGYAGGAWNGSGIMSTAAAVNSASYGLGYADSADPGNPAALASGQIEIKYTLLGDANLDGAVNGADFTILSAHFNQSVTNGWDEGDFNYDGDVNGADFSLLAANFNQSATQAASAMVTSTAPDDSTASSQVPSTDSSSASSTNSSPAPGTDSSQTSSTVSSPVSNAGSPQAASAVSPQVSSTDSSTDSSDDITTRVLGKHVSNKKHGR
jgi:beta-glucanase (GH16 family)